MTTHCDAVWDEDRGGPRHPDNKISLPAEGELYRATRDALEWLPAGAHDPSRCVIAGIHLECVFGKAPVKDPSTMSADRILTKSLDVHTYLAPGLDLLIQEGLIHDEEEDGSFTLHVFLTPHEFYKRADKLVLLRTSPCWRSQRQRWSGWRASTTRTRTRPSSGSTTSRSKTPPRSSVCDVLENCT